MYIKTREEIRILEEGGRRLAVILSRLVEEVGPGVSTIYLEDLANKLIEENGGRSAFKDYPLGDNILFPSTLCISINDEVVHGSAIPERIINEGDMVDIDIGMEWPATAELQQKFNAPINPHSQTGGFFTDTCRTVGVGKIGKDKKKLIRITKECLDLAIKQVKPGNTINDIAQAVQTLAEKNGYGVVRDLVGHGVGYFAHEKPDVFHFKINEKSPENVVLEAGMVIAIEPMINMGTWKVKTAKDGYTVITNDGAVSAHFEHTIAVIDGGCKVLTKYE